jgi:HEAT repeat protein
VKCTCTLRVLAPIAVVLLPFAAVATSTPEPIRVASATELLAAIGPDRTIVLAPGDYDLGAAPHVTTEYVRWEDKNIPAEIVVHDVAGLRIVGPEEGVARLYATPSAGLSFRNVRGLEVKRMTLGRPADIGRFGPTRDAGTLGGPSILDSRDVTIEDVRTLDAGCSPFVLSGVEGARVSRFSDGGCSGIAFSGGSGLRVEGASLRSAVWISGNAKDVVLSHVTVELAAGASAGIDWAVRVTPPAEVLLADVRLVDAITGKVRRQVKHGPFEAAATAEDLGFVLFRGKPKADQFGHLTYPIRLRLEDGREPLAEKAIDMGDIEARSLEVRHLGNASAPVLIAWTDVIQGSGGYQNAFYQLLGPGPADGLLIQGAMPISGHEGGGNGSSDDIEFGFDGGFLTVRTRNEGFDSMDTPAPGWIFAPEWPALPPRMGERRGVDLPVSRGAPRGFSVRGVPTRRARYGPQRGDDGRIPAGVAASRRFAPVARRVAEACSFPRGRREEAPSDRLARGDQLMIGRIIRFAGAAVILTAAAAQAPLLDRLVSDDYDIRLTAGYELESMPAGEREKLLPGLLAAFDDPKKRTDSMHPLILVGSGARPGLRARTHSADAAVRADAVGCLWIIKDGREDDVPTLVEALRDPDQRVRMQAAGGFSMIGPVGLPGLPAVIEGLGSLDNERQSLLLAITEMGPGASSAAPAVLAIHSKPEASESYLRLRPQAIRALGAIHADPALAGPALVPLLGDSDPEIAKSAALSLSALGDGAIPFLARALTSDSAFARGQAADALRRMGTPAAESVRSGYEQAERARVEREAEAAAARVATRDEALAPLPPSVDEGVPLTQTQAIDVGELLLTAHESKEGRRDDVLTIWRKSEAGYRRLLRLRETSRRATYLATIWRQESRTLLQIVRADEEWRLDRFWLVPESGPLREVPLVAPKRGCGAWLAGMGTEEQFCAIVDVTTETPRFGFETDSDDYGSSRVPHWRGTLRLETDDTPRLVVASCN